MPRATWGDLKNRRYAYGVEQGMLYVRGKTSVPWDGLVGVEIKPVNGKVTQSFIDGYPVYNDIATQSVEGTIKAITYPDAFMFAEGVANLNGLLYDNQSKLPFGLAWREFEADGSNSSGHITQHFLWNASAEATTKASETLNPDPTVEPFTWNVFPLPSSMAVYAPTAHISYSTRLGNYGFLFFLEIRLYGSDTTGPFLPAPDDLLNAITTYGYGPKGDGIPIPLKYKGNITSGTPNPPMPAQGDAYYNPIARVGWAYLGTAWTSFAEDPFE